MRQARSGRLGRTGEYLERIFGRFDLEGIDRFVLPTEVFEGELELNVGGKAVRLVEVGPAHTGGDVIVHVPGDRVVYTADILFVDRHPVAWAGPVSNWIKAIDLILGHLERHGPHLWGHAIRIPRRAGGGLRLVARTNNELESLFHAMKHGERRRSGRKILTQDFEALPPAAALAQNLRHADYVHLVCGSLDRLAEAFAQLDAANRSRSIAVGAEQNAPMIESD